MQQDKVKVELGGISASMLGCLWGRAQLSKEYSSLFYDEKAIELVEKIDYDFSASDVPFEDIWFNISRKVNLPEFGLFTLRARQFDEKAKEYIAEHPDASVINIAAGLDTTFYRVDNGSIHWYDLDLPAVIDIRRRLLPEPDRVTYIAKSLLDPSWFKDVKYSENGVFMIAGGVLHFLEEAQVKQFFSMLADNFPGGEIVFNAMSRSDEGFRAWMDMVPPEQRDAMKATLAEALKDWWEKAPQDQKDKMNDMIAALKTPTKPNGKEWSDLEAWWNQLSDEEKEGVMRDLMTAFRGGVGMWTIEDTSEFTKWDSRITVMDQFPMFKNIPRDLLSPDMCRLMDYSDEKGRSNIFHLRV
ncbi:MAG TPA: class I SAM-dependent methyltransferase [Candidatus Acidoferrales bacterium]|nr:class I SAM-dependent methyltransferase [Candidatus Acidoferrales bacterium]